jgi:hypothetical protein
MKRRVVPSALSLILSGGIPGLIAVTPAPAAEAKSAYTTLPDLSSYGGGGFSSATGINNNHQIAEASDTASGSNAQGQEHAFLLTQLMSAPRIYRPPA